MKIANGQVFLPDKQFKNADILIVDGQIAALTEPTADGALACWDASGCYVVPGLVDIHTHGCMGADFSDGVAADYMMMSRAYARSGTTGFLATTMTLPEAVLNRAMDAVAHMPTLQDGAVCLGVHLEGPFLSYEKRGAQAAEYLHLPEIEIFQRLNARSGGKVRLLTIAPEVPKAAAFIKEASQVCTVSLGHTTADYDTSMAAFAAGARNVTHLFNAMPPLLHRDPGLIGAAADSNAYAELICDGLHVHPATVRCAHQIFGNKLLLVSDSLRCAGMPDGAYTLGGQDIVMQNGKATLLNGTLAGSSSFLLQCVQKAISFGFAAQDAIYAATAASADAVGAGHLAGRILPGRRADLLVLNPDFTLKQVFIGGEPILN